MCERLAEVREAMGLYAAAFDAALLPAAVAARVVEDAAAIEKMAATMKGLAAARVAETELWKKDGDRLAAQQLDRRTGTTVCAAIAAVEAAGLRGSPPG